MDREIEVFLRLFEAIRVSRGLALQYRFDPGMTRQSVDLSPVKAGNRLDVGSAVPQFHKEALIELEPVRRSADCVHEAVHTTLLVSLSMNEGRDSVQGVEVLRYQFVVLDLEAVSRLHEHHQL